MYLVWKYCLNCLKLNLMGSIKPDDVKAWKNTGKIYDVFVNVGTKVHTFKENW